MRCLTPPTSILPLPLPPPNGKTSYRPWAVWWASMSRYRWMMIAGLLALIITNFAEIAIPRVVGAIIDELRQPTAYSFQTLTWCLFVFILVLTVGRYFWRMFLLWPTHEAMASLKSTIWERIRYFPKRRLQTDLTPGVLMNVATSDVRESSLIFGMTLIGAGNTLFLSLLSIVGMWLIDWTFAVATMVLYALLPFLARRISRLEMQRYRISQEALSTFNDLASQAVATVRPQRLTGTGAFWTKQLMTEAEHYRRVRLRALQTTLLYFPAMNLGDIMAYVLLCSLGAYRVFTGTISLGEFLALQSYVFLVQEPIADIGYIVSEYQRGMTSLARLCDVYVGPQDESRLAKGLPVQESPMCFDVQAPIVEREGRTLLANVSFKLRAGERLGITGNIGTGKTTLLHVMRGDETFSQGHVFLYGRDIRQYDHRALAQHMALIPQRAFLFADTVRENMKLDRDVSDEAIWEALEIAQVAEDVHHLSGKLDAHIGEWGVNLSGGQKQRLTIARALLRHPRVLLIDDALSAVDTVTEQRMIESINRHAKDMTMIWSAHRTSTLQYCDHHLELV